MQIATEERAMKTVGLAELAWSLLPAVVAGIAYAVRVFVPDAVATPEPDNLQWLLLAFLVVGLGCALMLALRWKWIASLARVVTLAAAVILSWDLVVAKLALLTPPFFPPPSQVFKVYTTDFGLLLSSVGYSLRILVSGWLLGAALGIGIGFLVGWYSSFRVWSLPLLRVIGPIPATALTALAIAIFPATFGSVFLVAFAVTFPVFMNAWSGVANVPKSLIEVAQTLGANEGFVIRRVVLPAAVPSIFTGLFIGLLVSFLTVVVAEMLGVKGGLGWYIWRAQGWAEYYRVYAAVIVMGFLFSFLLTALFSIRDRLLRWQQGVIRW